MAPSSALLNTEWQHRLTMSTYFYTRSLGAGHTYMWMSVNNPQDKMQPFN